MRDHSVFTRPECRCEGCCAVYDEWAEQAEGFQHWLTSLPDHRLADLTLGLQAALTPPETVAKKERDDH